MLKVMRLEAGAVTLLRVEGDVDEEGVKELRLALTGCLQDKRCNVVINLERASYVSYMGLGVFVERLRQLRLQGGDLRLAQVNVYTDRLLRMAAVRHLFESFETEGQAIESYRRAA